MEWFKRAPGVKIWVMVWLLVALVPLWRLHAVRQWQNDQINSPEMELKLGFSEESAHEAQRRFPNDLSAQLNDIWPRFFRIAPNTYSSSQTLGVNEQSKQVRQKINESFGRYAELLRRFPDSNRVRAQWLRDSTGGALAVESDELVATYRGTNLFERPQTQNWISKEQLEKVIRIARDGARLEPDNAFWPWMEAVFQFSLRRDEAALQALQKAGNCARFDDGMNQTTRERVALMHRVQTADFNDDLAEMWGALFPHLGRLRLAARAAMWQAKLALGRGDTARALQIAEIVQRAATPMARSRSSLITRLVGEAQCDIAWQQIVVYAGGKKQEFAGNSDPAQREAESRAIAEKFAAYARRNGRTDLAQDALNLQASFNAWKLRDALPNPDSNELLQASVSPARFHWLSAQLLQLTVWSAAVWLVTALLWRDKAPDKTRRATLICATFCIGATGALLGVAIRLGAVKEVSSWASGDSPVPNFDFESNLPLFLLLLWGMPLLAMSVLAAIRPGFRPEIRGARRLFIGQALLYAGLFGSFWIVTDAVSQPLGNTIAGQLWPAPPLIFALFLLAACIFHIWRARSALNPSACLLSGAALLWAPVFIVSQHRLGATLLDGFGWVYVWVLVLLLSSVVWWAKEAGLKKLARSPFVSELGTRSRLTAATLALCSTLAYFALIFAAMPARHHAQEILNQYLEIGQVAWLENELARRK